MKTLATDRALVTAYLLAQAGLPVQLRRAPGGAPASAAQPSANPPRLPSRVRH